MEPSTQRTSILQSLDRHERTGSSHFLSDRALAEQLNVPVVDVQRQLLILENRNQVTLAKTFGPNYAARLTPDGMEALEG
jgi:hypothetical protein